MESLVICLCLVLLMIIAFAVYVTMISSVFPKFILKVACSEKESKDRGLTKYIFPSGRGVVYVPRPTSRKYVESYALFTHEGYKYLKCNLCPGVTRLKYSVVMFNNNNEVIDVIDVDERLNGGRETESLLLHQDTSYISFVLNSAGGEILNNKSLFYCRVKYLIFYGLAVSVLSFLNFVFLFLTLDHIEYLLLRLGLISNINVFVFVLPALVVGAIASLFVYKCSRANGLRWTK